MHGGSALRYCSPPIPLQVNKVIAHHQFLYRSALKMDAALDPARLAEMGLVLTTAHVDIIDNVPGQD